MVALRKVQMTEHISSRYGAPSPSNSIGNTISRLLDQVHSQPLTQSGTQPAAYSIRYTVSPLLNQVYSQPLSQSGTQSAPYSNRCAVNCFLETLMLVLLQELHIERMWRAGMYSQA